ncbi:MAG: carbohydrate-binding protein [Myxococcota bacterium]|nr:carbohydrate-binding protein [Myxococcota bacterium]
MKNSATDPDTDSPFDTDTGPSAPLDLCPRDPGKTRPGTCGCGIPDVDQDSDGHLNCKDKCPTDPNKDKAGQCGCGTPDDDADHDGTPDCVDNCDEDPNKTEPGQCDCGKPDNDADSDSTPDCLDECDEDPNKTEPEECGCNVPEDFCVDPNLYEAEEYSSKSGCSWSAAVAGYTGEGFMVFTGNGSWIEWNNVQIDSPGEYILTFRYANGGLTGRPCAVVVNGVDIGTLEFAQTSTWSDWQTDTVTDTLLVGPNRIRVTANTAAGGPNLDSLHVSLP